MESKKEKELLYYEHDYQPPQHWKGAPLNFYYFKNVKSGESIILGACVYREEIKLQHEVDLYENILQAQKDYDILWDVKQDEIQPVAASFSSVQSSYQNLMATKMPASFIHALIIEQYQSNGKRK